MGREAAEYQDRIQRWERKTPLHRRLSARAGLQGKLVFSFMFLLVTTIAASSWQFISSSRQVTDEVLGAKALGIAGAVAVGAQDAVECRDEAALSDFGRKTIARGDVVGVAFFNPAGQLISASWRKGTDDGHCSRLIHNPRENPTDLNRARSGEDNEIGPYVEAMIPIRVPLNGKTPANDAAETAKSPSRIIGFVTVCQSRAADAALIGQAQGVVILIGAFGTLVSLPMVYMLVHRIFHPIRALLEATNRIAAGDLDAEVAVHRPDVIGALARSFNEMVKTVRAQQRELEGKVRDRTAQFEAANRRLRNEIAEKEDFLRAVSHDLNAPLRNIAGMASMLLLKHRESFDADVIHRLERIQKNVDVETALIAELLELSRIKTRRQKSEPVNLAELLGELAGVFEEDLRSRQINLVIDTPLPVLEAEPARMRQLFQNLIDNAIKYMGEDTGAGGGAGGAKEIRIGCTVRPGEAEFYVRDTGIGIEPEDLDKVFFVFRRGKSATVQSVAGKGIGLASVKTIVEMYEGTIWVESEVGRGTTFRFTINGKHLSPTSTPTPPRDKPTARPSPDIRPQGRAA
jgi:signal transduction histidine kinase